MITVAVIAFVGGFLWLQFTRARSRQRRREANVKIRDKMVAVAATPTEFVPVDASSVEGLNQEQLAAHTVILEQMGFERLLDYRLRSGGKTELSGFERVLVNTKEHCFAGIMAAGALQPNKPLYVAINSYMEDGWRLGTSNIPARKADYFLRLPRVLRMRYPDDSIEKLFARHLERRGEILRGLDIKILPEVSGEAYLRHARESGEQRKSKVETANPLGDMPLAEAQASTRNQEWLGDYPAEAERLRAQKKLVSS
jgi:hypothetical protein